MSAAEDTINLDRHARDQGVLKYKHCIILFYLLNNIYNDNQGLKNIMHGHVYYVTCAKTMF